MKLSNLSSSMTQTQRVLERIKTHGYVDNFWAIQNYILRLGARIKDLRSKGYCVIGASGKSLNKNRPFWKNYYYYFEGESYRVILETPKKEIVKVEESQLQLF